MNNCPICQLELKRIQRIFSARFYPINGVRQPEQIIFEGWCESCEIYIRKKTFGKQIEPWKTSPVLHTELGKVISDTELAHIDSSIRFQTDKDESPINKLKLWEKFIGMKKSTDQLFWYSNTDNNHSTRGFVIKRGAFLIGFYVYGHADGTLPN